MKHLVFIISLYCLSPLIWAEPDFHSSAIRPGQEGEVTNLQENITPIAENPEVEAQIAGQYPALNRQESLPLGAIQHAWDEAEEEAGTYQVTYHPRKIIRLITREFMTTTVVFPPWERIVEVVPGDKTAYQIVKPKPNLVVIIPNEFVGVDSSLTLIGESGNVYGCYIRSEGYNSEHVSDIVVQIRVPAPPFALKDKKNLLAPSLEEQNDYLEAVSFDPSELDFDFNMKGDKSIAPERVFNDGIRTWFDYGKAMGSKTLPAIYAVIDGVDTPINVTREGTFLIAHTIGDFTLKSGQKFTCVYKEPKNSKGFFSKVSE